MDKDAEKAMHWDGEEDKDQPEKKLRYTESEARKILLVNESKEDGKTTYDGTMSAKPWDYLCLGREWSSCQKNQQNCWEHWEKAKGRREGSKGGINIGIQGYGGKREQMKRWQKAYL